MVSIVDYSFHDIKLNQEIHKGVEPLNIRNSKLLDC